MPISVHFICGARGSACNNDAFSIVTEENGQSRVLDIIPAYEIPGKNCAIIKDAFIKSAASSKNISVAAIITEARKRLGCASKPAL